MNDASPEMLSIFAGALERSAAGDRAAYLDAACGADPELLSRIDGLLRAHDEAGGFLRHDPEADAATADQPIPAEGPGTLVGPYKLLEQIGEGGFGTVFLTEQTQPVRRKVALKVLKPGMDTRQVVARFEAERQALAIMDHPHIAKVLDGGATPSGRPFFVMELVRGVPITDYCDQAHLSPRDRLELFIQVCQAVQHAHQKGIIHRDLKPSNVLVSAHDGKPAAKVIDFGVAKAAGQALTDKTLFTGFAQMVGTPLYMSPEQAAQSPDIDTRSDIYTLGVLLYELLTGTTPFDKERLRTAGYEEMRRIIREEEPPKPSTRLSTLGPVAETVSANRASDYRRLTGQVKGELDWIVMKALEKDRGRRYETANSFAMDVQRYLTDEPVQACPPSMWYRLRKSFRRNKGRVLASAALVVSLLAGVAAVVVMQTKADRERATREAWTSASVAAEIREAREQVDEAWIVTDYPDRMQRATDAAVAALRRADDFAAGGSPTDTTRAELASTRQAVDELVRHTRLVVAADENRQLLADDSSLGDSQAKVNLYKRHHEALRRFGLDPIDGQVDDVAQAIANCRIRDVVLGMLLGWRSAIVGMANIKRARPQLLPDVPANVVIHADRLDPLIRAARHQCGGPYASWQDLIDGKDVPGLVAFASSPVALSFRPSLVIALSTDLTRAKENGACYSILRKAVDRYPHDAWLHYELSFVCQPVNARTQGGRIEFLRHLAAASALRPDSALFHAQIGAHYASNLSYDKAVDAYRKAIALKPESHWHYASLAGILKQMKDWEGMIEAWREAARLDPEYLGYRTVLRMALADTGRHAEAAEVLAEMRKNPAWVDDPRTNVRFVAACDAIRTANGLVVNPPPPAERPTFRKQALAVLTAELDAMRPRADTDRTRVYRLMQSCLTNIDLSWAQEPVGPLPPEMIAAWNRIPPEEQDAWNKLWADIRELRDRTAPPKTGK